MGNVDFKDAKWIWGKDNGTPGSAVVFRCAKELGHIPEEAVCYVACDTKFYLWINGKEAVYEGGVFRESTPGNGWAQGVDIAPYLKTGNNTFAILAFYYGKGGRNSKDSGRAGLIMHCDAIGLSSSGSFLQASHPAYVKSGSPYPSGLYGEDNICYDARLDFGDFTAEDFDVSVFSPAFEYENKVWGEQILSDLPNIWIGEMETYNIEMTENGAEIKLPYAMFASICLTVDAEEGEKIDIRTDRYAVNGAPGDEGSFYNCPRVEYICREGRNRFDCLPCLYGEKFILSFSKTVHLKTVGFRESGYCTKCVGSFVTDNPLFNRLIEKSVRTLYVCMRNNFMDCPDRERGQWIGDVSVQAPQVFFSFDGNAQKLLKKCILDFIRLRKGDILTGCVPGEHAQELPSQSLIAISEFGLIAEYYHYTHDAEIPGLVLEPMVRYLQLWEIDDRNGLIGRTGNWNWYDHLYNVDAAVMENCLYLSACKFALNMAKIFENSRFDSFLKERIRIISQTAEKKFWKGDCYASSGFADDRANAIAVLSGTCPKERYPDIRRVLLSVFHATPYMERFILLSLCKMGYAEDAYKRMMSRYYNLIQNENSTLWEDFSLLGTRNHAWSGAPLEIAFKYFLGISTDDAFQSFRVSPVKGIFKEMHCTFEANGNLVKVDVDQDGTAAISSSGLTEMTYIPEPVE